MRRRSDRGSRAEGHVDEHALRQPRGRGEQLAVPPRADRRDGGRRRRRRDGHAGAAGAPIRPAARAAARLRLGGRGA